MEDNLNYFKWKTLTFFINRRVLNCITWNQPSHKEKVSLASPSLTSAWESAAPACFKCWSEWLRALSQN